MSKSEHTRGPWKVLNDKNGGPWYPIESSSGWVCQVPVNNANARLIAAAPELYEAAKDLVQAYEYSYQARGGTSKLPELDALRAAIARVEEKS